MPLPSPKKGEKRKDFISRCMSEAKDEFSDQKQRLAVCFTQWRNRNKKANEMRILSAAPGQIRHDTLNGKDHLVIPVVALVEGVYQCATCDGPELYPAEEFGEIVSVWNGRPVTINHPQQNGLFVSAGSPEIFENDVIGTVFNSKLEDKKLKVEAWINLEKVSEIGEVAETLIDRVENGERVEISTGYFADVLPQSGKHEGQSYKGIQSNYRPDHLAILTEGKVGACSWKDGCGTPRINQCPCGLDCPCANRLDVSATAHKPSFEGTELVPWSDVDKSYQAFTEAFGGKAYLKTLIGSSSSDREKDILVIPVVNPATNKLNKDALIGVSTITAKLNILEGTKKSAQSMARRLLKSEFNEDIEVSQELLAHTNLMRISIDRVAKLFGLKKHDELSDTDVRRALDAALNKEADFAFIVAVFSDSFIFEHFGMLLRQSFRIDDDGTIVLGEQAEEVRPVTEFIPVKMEKESDMDKTERVNSLISNEVTKFTEDDRKWLETLEEDKLKMLEPNEKKIEDPKKVKDNKDPKPKDNEDPKKVKDNEDPKKVKDDKPQTAEEFIEKAPTELKDVLNSGLKMHRAQRDSITKGLLDHKRCEFTKEDLEAKSLEELITLSHLAGEEDDFSGRGGPHAAVANEDDAPPTPPLVFPEKKEA